MVSPLLSLQSVGKCFGSQRVLHDVSFDVRAGEVHVLAGENGAGKSTLIKILAGVHGEYEGVVRLRGECVSFRSPIEAAHAGVSVIHQELSLVDGLSIAENIFLGRENTRRRSLGQWLDKRSQIQKAQALCRELGLDIDVRRPVGELALSVKNTIEIAKALAWAPAEGPASRLLVLDEPTSALNAREAERLFELMAKLKKQGYGLIYISHKMEEIYRLADRITVLRDGRYVGTSDASQLPRARLVQWMVGRELSEQFPARRHEIQRDAPARLKVSQVRGVSLQVKAGEILGIGGLQGAGGSELLATLFGADGEIASGQIEIDGKPVQIRSPRDAIAEGVAFLTNDRKATGLILSLGIRENIALASLNDLSRAGWVSTSRERERAAAQKQRLRIRSFSLEQETGTLSGGNQQKVALAKWLEIAPKILLLDEPTRGVDVGAKHEIYELIRELTAQGMAVVLISTEMPELLALSDRILVMHRGRVSAELARGQATQEKVLEAAMGALL